MKIDEFIAVMERFAPSSLAMEYDNVGLLIGTKRQEIQNVLVALDCTEKVAEEAAAIGADLVLTHHPVFFKGIKRILPDDPETIAAYTLIRNGIALYAAHTNLDAASGGVNDVLAQKLGLMNIRPLPPENLGRIGEVPETTLYGFSKNVEKALDADVIVTGNKDSAVKIVAVIGGAGDGDIISAANAGADVFVTGELRHHHALEALHIGISVIAAGHYETERVILKPLIEYLQLRTFGIKYNLTLVESAPLWRL